MQFSFRPRIAAWMFMAWSAMSGIRPGTACEVVYPLSPSRIDSRYEYDWHILKTALEKAAPQHGPCTLRPSPLPMEARRATQELAAPGGRINLLVRATTIALERQFVPVRIPIDKGLLGYRILLVRSDDLARFAAVRDAKDLRALRIGQGKDWADVAILRAAGLNVVEGANYEGLFGMLTAGRFDAFSRAVDEALRELDEQRAGYPQLAIEPGVLLYYPLPRYFFLRRDAEGMRLAQRIESGLEIMVRDGTLDQLFQRYKSRIIERADLPHRRLILLDNPYLSPETPLSRSELWYRPIIGNTGNGGAVAPRQ